MGGIADVFDVRENPNLERFDHLIVGSAIRMAKATPELEKFLEKNRSLIGPKVRGLYTICGNMRQPVTPEVTKQQISDYLAPLCGSKDAVGRVFLGRATPKLLPPDIREQMKMMGEYDNLKRSDCMALEPRFSATYKRACRSSPSPDRRRVSLPNRSHSSMEPTGGTFLPIGNIQYQRTIPSHPRRSANLAISSTGDIVKAVATMISQSVPDNSKVPKVLSRKGTYKMRASKTSSHSIAILSHLFANGRLSGNCRL